MKSEKIRVNITVDKVLLKKAKTKLNLFGGKLSTLFNAYLLDFIESIEKDHADNKKVILDKIKELESRISRLETNV